MPRDLKEHIVAQKSVNSQLVSEAMPFLSYWKKGNHGIILENISVAVVVLGKRVLSETQKACFTGKRTSSPIDLLILFYFVFANNYIYAYIKFVR
jgi:hypothetical protein